MICGGGRIPDLRVSSLCINGKLVINKDRKITCKSIKTQTLDAKTLLINGEPFEAGNTEKITTETICVGCVKENLIGESVVIDKPLVQNPHGVGRIYLNESVKIEAESPPVEIVGNKWRTSFESVGNGPSMLLRNDQVELENVPLFQTPASYSNLCISNDWLMMVDVDIALNFEALNDINTQAQRVLISLKRNGVAVSGLYHQVKYTNNIIQDNIVFHDTVLLGPASYLTLEITSNGLGSIGLVGGLVGEFSSYNSWATFKIIGFIPNVA